MKKKQRDLERKKKNTVGRKRRWGDRKAMATVKQRGDCNGNFKKKEDSNGNLSIKKEESNIKRAT